MKKQKEEVLEPILRQIRILKVSKHIPKGSVVVDFGCGKNYIFLDHIKEKILGGIGLDVETKNRKIGNLTIKKVNLNSRTSVESGIADRVTLLATLEHFKNLDSVLKEAARILKKGGIILITTPSKISKPVLEFLSFKMGVVSTDEIKDHKNYFSREELKAMLIKSGFKDIKVNYFELGFNLFAMGKKE